MDIASLFLIAFGLSIDSFAVSVANGLSLDRVRVWNAVRVGLCFGFFQGLMPIAGWLAGMTLKHWIVTYDHWVAFGILAIVGTKMIIGERGNSDEKKKGPVGNGTLVMLGIATSIDALAVGLSFAFLKSPIAIPALIIGSTTFALSVAGVYIGKRAGRFFERELEVMGGVILITIGLRILFEHLLA